MNRWDGYGELYHHGILGQKWGIRRYQNEDGTLTEEGKKRYGKMGLRESTPAERARAARRTQSVLNAGIPGLIYDIATDPYKNAKTQAEVDAIEKETRKKVRQERGVEAALTSADLSLKAGMLAGTLSGGNPAVAITAAALSEIGNVAVSKWIGDKQYDFVKKHSNLSFA